MTTRTHNAPRPSLTQAQLRKKADELKGTTIKATWKREDSDEQWTWIGRLTANGKYCSWTAMIPRGASEPVPLKPVRGEFPFPNIIYLEMAPHKEVSPPPRLNVNGRCAINAALACLWPMAWKFKGITREAIEGDERSKAKLIAELEKAKVDVSPGKTCTREVLDYLAAKNPGIFTHEPRITSADSDNGAAGEGTLEAHWTSAALYNDERRHWVALVRSAGVTYLANDGDITTRDRGPPGFEAAMVVKPSSGFHSARKPSDPSGDRTTKAPATSQPAPPAPKPKAKKRVATPQPPSPTKESQPARPKWSLLQDSQIPPMALKGTSVGQRSEHRRWLRTLDAELPVVDATSVVAFVEDMETRKGWSPATTAKHLATIAGALRRLPMYANEKAIILAQEQTWLDASKGARLNCNTVLPKQATPATLTDITATVPRLSRLEDKVAIIIAWTSTARLGDVLQLTASDVVLTESKMELSFRRGKRARFSGPYTVATTLSPAWAKEVKTLLAAKRPGEFLFPFPTLSARLRGQAEIMERARQVSGSESMESRSLRRGALQTLALAGTDEQTLMLFSGHSRPATLMRYLDFGSKASSRKTKTTEAAAAWLIPAVTSPAAPSKNQRRPRTPKDSPNSNGGTAGKTPRA